MLQKTLVREAMTLAALGGCLLCTQSAMGVFEQGDIRHPAPRYDASNSVSFETVQGPVTIDSFFDVFTELSRAAPPGLGSARIDSFFDVFVGSDFGTASGPIQFLSSDVQCDIETQAVADDGVTQTFDTEMLSMSLSGGGLPAGVRVRESPTLQSLGRTTMTDVGGGLYRIDSFFDVFTELSIDDGQTWMPSSGSLHLNGVPEPTTLGVLAGAWAILVHRQRRQN